MFTRKCLEIRGSKLFLPADLPPGPDASLVYIILTREIDRLQDCEIFCNEIIILIVAPKNVFSETAAN